MSEIPTPLTAGKRSRAHPLRSGILPAWPEPQERDIDSLTGVLSVQYALRVIDEIISKSRAISGTVAVAHANLDFFLRANVDYGWPTADAMLVAVAAQLSFVAGSRCRVCRTGGDEFVVIRAGASAASMRRLAERIRRRVRETHYEFNGMKFPPLTVSIGVAAYPGNGKDAHHLLAAAQTACYCARIAGRDRVCMA